MKKIDIYKLKNSIKIEDLLAQYSIEYDSKHKRYYCPFHDDQTPSLSIKDNIFNCFACGKKGDIIYFTMQMENCDFKTAIQRLATNSYINCFTNSRDKIQRKIIAQDNKNKDKYLNYIYPYLCAYAIELRQFLLEHTHLSFLENRLDYLLDKYMATEINKDEILSIINDIEYMAIKYEKKAKFLLKFA